MNLTTDTKILIGTGLAALVLLFGGVFFLSKNDQKRVEQETKGASTTVLIREDSYKISTDSAKTTIVEFGDFQCPACGVAHPIVAKVLSDFNGKINFVFRNFPLPQHQNAQMAAESAEAAGEQGKYWEMYTKLYENQKDWGESSDAKAKIENYANDLGLDMDKFKQEVAANKFADKIQRDISDGSSLGVTFTPTFYINGIKQPSTPTYEEFKTIIEGNSK